MGLIIFCIGVVPMPTKVVEQPMHKIIYLFMDLKGQPIYVGFGKSSRPKRWLKPSYCRSKKGARGKMGSRFAGWMLDNDFAAQWVIIERGLSIQCAREIEAGIIKALGTIDSGGPLLNFLCGNQIKTGNHTSGGGQYHTGPVRRSDGEIFPSSAAAARALRCSQGSIRDVIQGRRKTIYGFLFEHYKPMPVETL